MNKYFTLVIISVDSTLLPLLHKAVNRCASFYSDLKISTDLLELLMETVNIKFRDWTFEVNKALTEQTYKNVSGGGADTCSCNDCKNYVAYRDKVFPIEIIQLFTDLGIDFRKEVEITTWEILPNGLHHIGGWFHFKGQVLTGKDYRIPLPSGGHTFDLTSITDNFSIGFAEGNDLTFFEDKTGLVQVEFGTNIPWVIDKSLESV